MAVRYNIRKRGDVLILDFMIEGGVLDVSELREVVEKAPDIDIEENEVLCISGRGPIWLYGALIDKYRDRIRGDIATYDPRIPGCIVVTGYRKGRVIQV